MDTTKIDARIKLPIPPNMKITPFSTPVVWFGNYELAKACTISINPSDKEFYHYQNGKDDYTIRWILLTNKAARLCSRDELKKNDHEPLDNNDVIKVKEYCNNYFDRNPLRDWFDPFERFLKKFGDYSYYGGTCVHFDMVQWATTPKWDDLPDDIKKQHINNDLPILKQLLEKKFEVIFLNGTSVVEIISKYLNIKSSEKTSSINGKKTIIYTGEYNRTKVIGWNQVLQRQSLEYKDILCDLIKRVCS